MNPTTQMELTQQQKDAVREKLDAKIAGHELANCEMCGNDAWAIDPYIMELREFGKGGMYYGRPVIPLISLHCTKCGNSKMFNAIVLEVIDEATGEVVVEEKAVVGGT